MGWVSAIRKYCLFVPVNECVQMKTYGPAKVTNCNVASLSGSDNMERIDFPGRNIFRPRSFIIVVGNDNVGIGGGGGGE